MSFHIRQQQNNNLKLCVNSPKTFKKKIKLKNVCRARKWFYHCRGEYATMMDALDFFVFRDNKRFRCVRRQRLSWRLCAKTYDRYNEIRSKYQDIITKFQRSLGSNRLMAKGFAEILKKKSQEGFLYEKRKFDSPDSKKFNEKLIKNYLSPKQSEAVIFTYLESKDV